jgi:hypothetical protein
MVQYSFSILCRPEAVVARTYSQSKMNLEIEIFSTTILNSSDLCLIFDSSTSHYPTSEVLVSDFRVARLSRPGFQTQARSHL